MSRLRTVVVRLKAEVAGFKQEMAQATYAVDQVGKKSKESAQTSSTAMGQLAQSLTRNRDAWNDISNKALVAGGAMTAVTGAVLATGISYNTLQQTSRAALTTLLGGAEAANAQMDKLDEFARSSPFAKQVFIEAQRQLIGFGMEAERVIPTLDAIQNAVAATGGSNQDIAELVRIIAQVGAAGKITAVDLMQFGQRGVDAATLIGSQMGKTGAQIREEITAGTLGADEAITALTAGMQERFGGAAEGVKDTFDGAMDRVKAAIRDVASEFASAFVDPQGGGLLVDWTNKLADLLRMFQALPDPIKNVTGGLFALSGVGLLAFGSFVKVATSAYDTWTSFQQLKADAPKVADGMNKVGRAAGYVAGALAALAVADALLGFDALALDTNVLTKAMLEGRDAVDGINRSFAEAANVKGLDLQVRSLGDAIQYAFNPSFASQAENVVGAIRSLWMDENLSRMGVAKQRFEDLDAALAQLASSGKAEKAAEIFQQIATEAEKQGVSLEELQAMFPGYESALAAASNQANLASGSIGEMNVNLAEQEAAAEAAAEAQRSLAEAVIESANAQLAASGNAIGYQKALDAASESVKKHGANLDITTEAGQANRTALDNVASSALKVAESNLTAGDSTAKVSAEMVSAREDFIQMAIQMGATRAEAEAMANQYELTTGTVHALSQSIKDVPSKKRTDFATNAAAIQGQVQALQRAIDNLKGKTVIIATQFSGPGAQYVRSGTVGINASGGMWDKSRVGLVRAYAGGGFFDGSIGAQQPQVRPYAGPKGLLWSEEGSGPWEAFISGHPAKADRSRQIWLDVGRRLGMIAAHADGAVRQYAQVSGGGSVIDYDRLAAALERGAYLGTSAGAAAGMSGKARYARTQGVRS